MTYFGWEMELLRMIQELHTQLLTPVLIFLSWINNHGEFWILTGLILTIIPKNEKVRNFCIAGYALWNTDHRSDLKGNLCETKTLLLYGVYGRESYQTADRNEGKGAAAFLSFRS